MSESSPSHPTAVDPTQTLGEHNHHDVQAEVIALFELPEQAFEAGVHDFVTRRVVELSGTEDTPVMQGGGIVKDFIPPGRSVYMANSFFRPIHMDDPAAYAKAFKWVKRQYAIGRENDPAGPARTTYMNAAIQGSVIGSLEYFGPHNGNDRSRMLIAGDIVGGDDAHNPMAPVSIRDFGAAAKCVERAAVTHNTLRILGVDSRFNWGKLQLLGEGEVVKEEAHAWLTIKTDSGIHVLFDPTNPKLHKDKDGSVVWADPILRLVDTDRWMDGVDAEVPTYQADAGGSPQVISRHDVRYHYEESPFLV